MSDITLVRNKIFLSVVICSYNEAHCIENTIRQIETALPIGYVNEVIVIDDSFDETPQIVDFLSQTSPYIRLLHRSPSQRNGLGGAILAGIKAARGTYVLVMDADGQHPPEIISKLLDAAEAGNDFVLPSRYIDGGSVDGLANYLRTFYSWSLRMLPRCLFPYRIGKITDPLSGYFLFRRDIVDVHQMQAGSWKILLELLLFARWTTYTEIPYSFQKRSGGESKASIKVGIDYISHLASLIKRFYFLPLKQSDWSKSLSMRGNRQ